MRSHSKGKEEKFSAPLGYETWSPGTESQCAPNELRCACLPPGQRTTNHRNYLIPLVVGLHAEDEATPGTEVQDREDTDSS